MVALLLAVSSDLLGLIAVGGFAAAVLLLPLLSWVAVKLLRRAVNEPRAPRWMVLAARRSPRGLAFAVCRVGAGRGLLALVLLVLLRTDLISSWRRATPPDAPTASSSTSARAGRGLPEARRPLPHSRYDWYPMIRGRLVAINGKPVRPATWPTTARRLVDREFNLSHTRHAAAAQRARRRALDGRGG